MKIIISESQLDLILSERFRFPKVSKPKITYAAQPVKPVSPLIKQLESLKPNYLKQFGQQKYNELLYKLTSKQISKEQFFKELSSKKTTGVVQGVKGVVMTPDEITKITKMSEKIAAGQIPANTILKVKVGNTVQDIPVEFVSQAGGMMGGYNPISSKFRFNVKNFSNQRADEIKRTIYHEVTHAKDPMPSFFKQNKAGEYYMTGTGNHYANQYLELGKKMDDIVKNTPKGQSLPKEYHDLQAKGEKLYSKYVNSPVEKTANFQMIYNSIPDKINAILKDYSSKFGKKKATETLDSILGYLKGKGGNIQNIIGQRQVDLLNDLKKNDLNQYNSLVKKITQQVESIRTQL